MRGDNASNSVGCQTVYMCGDSQIEVTVDTKNQLDYRIFENKYIKISKFNGMGKEAVMFRKRMEELCKYA